MRGEAGRVGLFGPVISEMSSAAGGSRRPAVRWDEAGDEMKSRSVSKPISFGRSCPSAEVGKCHHAGTASSIREDLPSGIETVLRYTIAVAVRVE